MWPGTRTVSNSIPAASKISPPASRCSGVHDRSVTVSKPAGLKSFARSRRSRSPSAIHTSAPVPSGELGHAADVVEVAVGDEDRRRAPCPCPPARAGCRPWCPASPDRRRPPPRAGEAHEVAVGRKGAERKLPDVEDPPGGECIRGPVRLSRRCSTGTCSRSRPRAAAVLPPCSSPKTRLAPF